MYLIQWQGKNRLGKEGEPSQCDTIPLLCEELLEWYRQILLIIQDFESDTTIRILYPPRKIYRIKSGETLQIFEVYNDISPEFVTVTRIDNIKNRF